MEENQPMSTPPVNPTPAAPSEPVVEEPQKSGTSGILVALLFIAVLLAVVAAGAYYWYTAQTNVGPKQTIQVAAPTPIPTETLDNMATAAANLQIEDIEQDFTAIDSDLGNL